MPSLPLSLADFVQVGLTSWSLCLCVSCRYLQSSEDGWCQDLADWNFAM